MMTEAYDGSRRPSGNNADEWHLFLSEYHDSRAFLAVQIAEALDAAYNAGRHAIRREVFALHENTVEEYHGIAETEMEHKSGAYARGRCVEAKSIARAVAEVCHTPGAWVSKPLTPSSTSEDRE